MDALIKRYLFLKIAYISLKLNNLIRIKATLIIYALQNFLVKYTVPVYY